MQLSTLFYLSTVIRISRDNAKTQMIDSIREPTYHGCAKRKEKEF